MPSCDEDYVEIYIGCTRKSIGRYCSDNSYPPHDIYSPDNCLRIKFRSDSSGFGEGFIASYSSIRIYQSPLFPGKCVLFNYYIKIFDPVISDHCAVHCNLRVQKLHFTKKKVYYRKLHSLDIESFCENILTSPLLQDQAVELNALVDQYGNVLRSHLDLFAPLKRRTVTLQPSAPWYKPEVVVQKNIRRRLEWKWRSTGLLCDREQCIHQCYVVNNLIESLNSIYYTDIINEHSSDQRILFKTVGKLLQKSTNKRYPPSSGDTTLANSFADFFTSKIDKIHHGLVKRKIRVGSSPPGVKVCVAEF